MTYKIQTAVLCSLSVLLAACGSGNDATQAGATRAPALAAQVQASAPQQAISAYYTAVQQIYVAYFGRAADADGLVYFATNLRDAGAPTTITALGAIYTSSPSVRAIIDVFGTSAESAALYPGTNDVFIAAVYQNLFGRAADAAGKAYWVDLLNRGLITRASAAVSIMSGAQGSDIDVINKKATVAGLFTTAASSGAAKLAYDGLAANVIVRAMLNGVTLATDVSTAPATINTTLAALAAARPAAGMYAGTLSSGGQYNTLVLDDDSYYGFYNTTATGGFAPTGFLQGQGKSASGSYSVADLRDFNAPKNLNSLAATYIAQNVINANITLASGSVLGVSNTVIDPAIYDYNKPAALSELLGTWTLKLIGSAALQSITVAADGSFSGTSTLCPIAGLLTPRGNKNVFNVAISFGAAITATGCPLSGSAVTGVAFSYAINGGVTRQLVMTGTTPDRSGGALLYGTNAIVTAVPTTLSFTDTVVGAGTLMVAGKTPNVRYSGWIYDPASANLKGALFDSGTFSFKLGTGAVVPGFDQGVTGMRVGGKRTIIIPSALGYGSAGAGTSIPPNAVLVFDVEVLSSD